MYIEINDYKKHERGMLTLKGAWDHCKATVEVVGLFVPPGYDLPPDCRRLALFLQGEEEDIEQCASEIMQRVDGAVKYHTAVVCI